MGTEIERKFLVVGDGWRQQADRGTPYRQGYLAGTGNASVRVRLEGDQAFLNIKSATLGVRRHEFQYSLPIADAQFMLENLCEQPLVEKIRYHVQHAGHLWEIDEFAGDNAGLLVAEVELTHEDEPVALPPWVGAEVSHDPRYYNVSLVKHPYGQWKQP
ncbi:MAG: CYTH domain-containing protein [Pseudomonadota bacterium]|nr:MAG: CYTH domain-containing protein [Pseudomonadota bacterium]